MRRFWITERSAKLSNQKAGQACMEWSTYFVAILKMILTCQTLSDSIKFFPTTERGAAAARGQGVGSAAVDSAGSRGKLPAEPSSKSLLLLFVCGPWVSLKGGQHQTDRLFFIQTFDVDDDG